MQITLLTVISQSSISRAIFLTSSNPDVPTFAVVNSMGGSPTADPSSLPKDASWLGQEPLLEALQEYPVSVVPLGSALNGDPNGSCHVPWFGFIDFEIL
jgi:hypothetical protein